VTAWPDTERALPRLHLVTDDRVLAEEGFVPTARALLSAGGSGVAFHLRGPATAGGRLYELASSLTDAARASGSLLIVNDRVDVALASGADGVQLGRHGLALASARLLLGAGALIGASVHADTEAREAFGERADFVLAGTLYESRSHPGRPPTGLAWLARIGASGRVIGIGGITPARVAPVLESGAYGVAVLSAVWRAPRPADALRLFMKALY
jgi:thiamine-phosphate pyrophosphorylase